jgi:hypothetical protein
VCRARTQHGWPATRSGLCGVPHPCASATVTEVAPLAAFPIRAHASANYDPLDLRWCAWPSCSDMCSRGRAWAPPTCTSSRQQLQPAAARICTEKPPPPCNHTALFTHPTVGPSTMHVQLATHENRGRILEATQACHAGQEVLREDPVIIFPPSCQDRGRTDAQRDYRYWCTQPPVVQVCVCVGGGSGRQGTPPMES